MSRQADRAGLTGRKRSRAANAPELEDSPRSRSTVKTGRTTRSTRRFADSTPKLFVYPLLPPFPN